ncbi:MAG: metallopeptidase family protein [Kiritimatiellaeota bacterium]|nr:metallopeptidase family protein [Kiritimatiellota bacterium]
MLAALPPEIRERLEELPRPSSPSRTPPWAPTALMPTTRSASFTGVSFARAIEVSQRLPPQIIPLLDNIYEYVRGDAPEFRIQVRRTLLHESGHYLGFDEDEVGQRGL